MSRLARGLTLVAGVTLGFGFAIPARSAPPPPTIAAPVDSARVAWAEARELADQGRHPQALAVIQAALALHPDDIDLRWLEAGVTGWAGHHADAVRLYERLIADHPSLAGDVCSDLATERLWAGDPRGAARDFDRRLADEPGDRDARGLRALALAHADRLHESLAAYDSLLAETPGSPGLMMQRARVLSWMGRNGDAERAYRDVLAVDAGDRDAILGLARVQNWAGLHRRAIERLEPLAGERDADPEVLKTLAFAYAWSGNPGLASQWIEAYLVREPNDREGLELRRRLEHERGRGVSIGSTRADDSDELRVGTTSLELRWPIGLRHTATLGAQRDNVRDPGGTHDPRRLSGGFESIWPAQIVTRVTVSRCDLGRNAGTVGLGEASLAWRPADRFRADLGVSHDLVMTRLALANGISAHSFVEGIDWNPAERLMLHADTRQRFTSDDNSAQAEALSARWQAQASRTHRLAVSVRGEQLRVRRDLANGYYDPPQYVEWGPGVEAEWTPQSTITLSANGQTGWQRERGAGTKPFANASARVEWVIDPVGTFAIEGGRSSSNLQTASGYEQKRWAVSLSRGF